MTLKHYFANPLVFHFVTTVVESTYDPDEMMSKIILEETYFYPTGGGQSHDVGVIGGLPVYDVYNEGDYVVHVAYGELNTIRGGVDTKEVECFIDEDYRRRNMASHTGQHILSAILLRELNAETLAVRMTARGLSTVDVSKAELKSDIYHIQRQVNRVIRDNRSIYSRFVAPDSPELEQLRRAVKFDKVTGDVRLVEIEGVDLSACAGTHYPSTGMLGMLKILKVENYKGGSRIHFAVGDEALDQFNTYQYKLDTISNLLSSGIDQVTGLVEKLQSERSDLAKQIASQQEQLITYEAQAILADNTAQVITLTFENRDANALRTLANLLIGADVKCAVMINQQGEDVMLMIASDTDNIHAGNTLRAILVEFDGRGGGRETFAQGVLKNFNDIDELIKIIDYKLP